MRRAELPVHGEPGDPALSARQYKIVQVIEDSVRSNGYGPSLREIAEAVGLASTSSVSYQLSVLAEKGYLTREAGRPRTAVIRGGAQRRTSPPPARPASPVSASPVSASPVAAAPVSAAVGLAATAPVLTRLARRGVSPVPLVGRIAAGIPITAEQQVEDIIPLPKQLVGEGNLIMLRVVGESMIDAAITDGDWVVVRRESDVENGDIVAAEIDSDTTADREATVKTFKRVDGHVWLIPHNPLFAPLMADNAKIIGKVVSVLRKL
jgi:repressor LexA